MARSFQQQSLQRKLTYFILILVLFFATLLLRGQYVTAKAEELGLREKSHGKVELTGSALRLTLTGSRGLVVCFLWMTAMDLQARNEWNELELVVTTLTKLQPHFVTPWLFQSWNLAYNVSVESERIKDKYFYISRGIDLLAEGERENLDNFDLRGHMGVYYRDKIGQHDQNDTLRSLLQMSCIDPSERNPARFRPDPTNRHVINLAELEDFCRRHPILVRRLHDKLGCRSPRELVDFLDANRKLPSRFEETPGPGGGSACPMKPREKRFPILPPRSPILAPQEFNNDSELGDDFDTFQAARSWFGYAQDPMEPPLSRVPRGGPVILRGYLPLAQTFVADEREKDGWFDGELWPLAGWFFEDNSRPASSRPRTVLLGDARRNWAGEAWEKAHQMFIEYGRKTGMYHTPEEEAALTSRERHESVQNRGMTNFDHWMVKTDVERAPEAVTAHKRFYEAQQYHRAALFARELEKYEDRDAFGPPESWNRARATGWMKLLYDHPQFQGDRSTQEETYEICLDYLNAVHKVRGPEVKRRLTVHQALAAGMAGPAAGLPLALAPVLLSEPSPPPFRLPVEALDEHGQPLVPLGIIQSVHRRKGVPLPPQFAPAEGESTSATAQAP